MGFINNIASIVLIILGLFGTLEWSTVIWSIVAQAIFVFTYGYLKGRFGW